jgi:hypothetical protein
VTHGTGPISLTVIGSPACTVLGTKPLTPHDANLFHRRQYGAGARATAIRWAPVTSYAFTKVSRLPISTGVNGYTEAGRGVEPGGQRIMYLILSTSVPAVSPARSHRFAIAGWRHRIQQISLQQKLSP